MKIRLSRKIDFNKFNKIQINNIFNKAMTNENVFDTYDVNKYNHPRTTLHCMLIQSPVNVVTGIDINDSIIDQYVESYDEYRKNQVGHSGRVYTLNIDDEIAGVYPARVKFRGFSEDSNTQGYKNITNYLKENVNDLYEEINKE